MKVDENLHGRKWQAGHVYLTVLQTVLVIHCHLHSNPVQMCHTHLFNEPAIGSIFDHEHLPVQTETVSPASKSA